MAIYAPVPEEREWQNPPEGVHQGVVYAVELRSNVETKFGVKSKVLLKIQLNPDTAGMTTYKNDKGVEVSNPPMATMFPTLSMFRDGSKVSILRKTVEALANKKFANNAEAARFDIESLIGANGLFQIIHNKSADGEKVYANVETVMPLPKGTKPITPVNVGNGGTGDDDEPPF